MSKPILEELAEALRHCLGCCDIAEKCHWHKKGAALLARYDATPPPVDSRDAVLEEAARVVERQLVPHLGHRDRDCAALLQFAVDGIRALKTQSPKEPGRER